MSKYTRNGSAQLKKSQKQSCIQGQWDKKRDELKEFFFQSCEVTI